MSVQRKMTWDEVVEQWAKCKKERDELQKRIEEYERLEIMQIEAGARAANLYNEKHGTDIGQLDLAQDMVFLMEQNDGLRAQVAVLRGELSADLRVFKSLNRYPFNCDEAIKRVKNALTTTPSEAAERVQKLVEALKSTADDIGIEVNNLQDVHNGIVQSAVHHLQDVASGMEKALADWRR